MTILNITKNQSTPDQLDDGLMDLTRFTVIANGQTIGEYEAQSMQEACDLAAQDAGYHSVVDMEDRLGEPSALVAEVTAARDE